MTTKRDVLLMAIPLMQIKQPAPAIYHLKGQLTAGGVTCMALDANIILYNKMKDRWEEISRLLQWRNSRDNTDDVLYERVLKAMEDIVNDSIIRTDPEWIGVSIFSRNSRRLGKDLLSFIRSKFPNKKLIIGGMGLGDSLGDTKFEYAVELFELGLVDYYITGEAELNIVELICNNTTRPGINSPMKQIMQLEELAFADYTDCDHDLYPFSEYDSGLPTYVLTGSRGCVRRCDFCDVYRLWPKFKSRGGEHIAKEMIYHYEQRGVYNFSFSDSLINGNMKTFRELVDILIDNQKKIDVKFRWGGQFICRSDRQMPLEDYIKASNAGLESVGIGLEHASERIRKLMRKGFDHDALHDTIHNLSKSNIRSTMNMMSGHPSETEDDHNENLKFLESYKWASDNGTIAGLVFFETAFLPGTDFFDKKDELVEQDVGPFWKNDIINFPLIHKRRKQMGDRCAELGWHIYGELQYMDKEFWRRELEYYNETVAKTRSPNSLET